MIRKLARPGKKNKWCPEEDSNLHASRRQYLKLVRLPIPPSGPSVAAGGPQPVRAGGCRDGRARRQWRSRPPAPPPWLPEQQLDPEPKGPSGFFDSGWAEEPL